MKLSRSVKRHHDAVHEAGERLRCALAMEADLWKQLRKGNAEALRAAWKEVRESVGPLHAEYAAALQRWRIAVQEAADETCDGAVKGQSR